MTDDALRAIRERWAAATPGPWEHGRGYYDQGGTYLEIYRADDPTIEIFGEYREPNEADIEAIAAAPTDIAVLLAEIDELQAERAYAASLPRTVSLKDLYDDGILVNSDLPQ